MIIMDDNSQGEGRPRRLNRIEKDTDMADNAAIEGLQEVQAALDAIEIAAETPARSRTTNLTPYVDDITEFAYQFGLQVPELTRLARILTVKTELDQNTITLLIKNLYPAVSVPNNVVVLTVGSFGQSKRKPSPASQGALVRWLTAVHDVLEEPAFISRLYGVLFNLLDMMSLRTPLCQLLALITRRRHVRPFRMQRLLELCQQYGNDTGLVGMLRVYKNFYPEIIIGTDLQIRSTAFSQPDIEWRKRMLAIQDVATRGIPGGTTATRHGFKIARHSAKRAKSSALPEVHTFRAGEASVTLEEIDSVESFVENLEKIEAPSQLVAGLKDPLLQKYLALNASAETIRRLEFWLSRCFEEELETLKEGFGVSPTLSEILTALISFTEATKEIHPVAVKFFKTYLPMWNGVSDLGLILDLLAYLPAQRFDDVYTNMLAPLERAILGSAHDPFVTLFYFYQNLSQKWIEYLASRSPRNTALLNTLQGGFLDLQNHIGQLALSALASDSSTSAVISYYEATARTTLSVLVDDDLAEVPLSIMETQIFYLLLLNSSLSSLSRLCSVLLSYRSIAEHILHSSKQTSAELTNRINAYLMDTCNLLWRSRALVRADANALGCLCPPNTVSELQLYLPNLGRDYSLASIFGFSWHPLTAAVSRAAFSELEDAQLSEGELETRHAGPVSQRSLVVLSKDGGAELSWKQYRIKVLDWLEERSLGGVKALMFTTMKDLVR